MRKKEIIKRLKKVENELFELKNPSKFNIGDHVMCDFVINENHMFRFPISIVLYAAIIIKKYVLNNRWNYEIVDVKTGEKYHNIKSHEMELINGQITKKKNTTSTKK